MRALIFDGTRADLATSHPEPEPAEGDAVIRTVRAGISRTDHAICRGLLDFRGILGHEFVGVVESVGKGVERGVGAGLVGKRVVGSIGTFCGRCDMCLAGLSPHCRHRTILGVDGRDGCLAERFALPAANLVVVPDSVDDDHAVFAGLVAAGLQAVRQLTIEGKPYITVLGDGPLGLIMVQLMAKLNASVRVVGRRPEKLAICEKWGIKHRHVDDVGRRADQDIVVDCTGTHAGLALAMRLVRPRGTVVLKSLVPPARGRAEPKAEPLDLAPIVLNEINVVGSHVGPLGEAVTALARGEVDVVSLISRRVSLADGAALLQSGESRNGALKVLVRVA